MNYAGPQFYPADTESAIMCLWRAFKRHTGTLCAAWLPYGVRAAAADRAVNAAEGLDLVTSYQTILK
jgi:hypothetical protein